MEGGGHFAHSDSLERLPAAQQFAVDLGDRFQDLAGSVVVGDELGNLGVRLLRHIIHLWPQARVAHREVILGAMTGAVGAFASRLATAFVTLDQRAAQDRFDRGHLAHNLFATSSPAGTSPVFHFFRSTYKTGLILPEA